MTTLSPTVITHEVEQDYRTVRGYSFVDWFTVSLERQFAIRSSFRRTNTGFEFTGSSVSVALGNLLRGIRTDARRRTHESGWREVRDILLNVLHAQGQRGPLELRRMTTAERNLSPQGSPLKAGYVYDPNAILVDPNLGKFRMVSRSSNYPRQVPERAVSPALLIAHELTHLLPTRMYSESQAITLINAARAALNLPVRHTHGSMFYYPNVTDPNPGIWQWITA